MVFSPCSPLLLKAAFFFFFLGRILHLKVRANFPNLFLFSGSSWFLPMQFTAFFSFSLVFVKSILGESSSANLEKRLGFSLPSLYTLIALVNPCWWVGWNFIRKGSKIWYGWGFFQQPREKLRSHSLSLLTLKLMPIKFLALFFIGYFKIFQKKLKSEMGDDSSRNQEKSWGFLSLFLCKLMFFSSILVEFWWHGWNFIRRGS